MKRIVVSVLGLLTMLTTNAWIAAQDKDVPDIAHREIQRRGNLVQRISQGQQDDIQATIAEAMRPPADDSHKWFISVITARNCKYCDNLKRDFATSSNLKAFVDTEDHTQSWAHFNVYQADDQTQTWRFKDIKIGGYPTLIIQPPRNGRFGDPKTVVLQKTGYDGDAKNLADSIRTGINTYLRTYVRHRESAVSKQSGAKHTGVRQGGETAIAQNVVGYDPPFTPPPKVDPAPYYPTPTPYPFDLPPGPNPAPNAVPQPTVNPLALLLSLLGGLVSSGGMTNVLLLAIAGMATLRTFRKATGQKLLLDDATFQTIIDTLKSLTNPTIPKTPPN